MFTEKKAEWKEKKEEFKLKGKTPDNGTILVLNAVDRSLIAEIEPSHDHFSLRTTIQGGLGVPLGVSAFTDPIGDAVDTLSFYADGSGTTKIAGIPFTWSEFGGVLTLNYSSPANEPITEEIRLLDTLDGVHGAFYEFTNNVTGERFGTYGLAIRQDPLLVFTLSLMQTTPGTFWNADGLNGQNKSQYDVNGQPLFTSHFSWGFTSSINAEY